MCTRALFCGTTVIVGVYLQSGDEVVASGQAEDVLQQAIHTGFRFVAIGVQPPAYLASGNICAVDECRPGEELPPTGPRLRGRRRRRIDFAVQHVQLRAQEVLHFEGPSDHVIVSYTYDLSAPKLRRGPRRRLLQDALDPEVIAAEFANWDQGPFDEAIRAGNLDQAWALLSDVAEDLLCHSDSQATPCSRPWLASEPSCPNTGRSPGRSAGLRLILKLQTRLQVAQNRPYMSRPCMIALVDPFVVCAP